MQRCDSTYILFSLLFDDNTLGGTDAFALQQVSSIQQWLAQAICH
jgi:hypothetical protein